jgi:hypothetical protein
MIVHHRGMDGPFREMPDVLGAAEREEAAIIELGRWRGALQTRVLVVFAALLAVPLAFVGYLVVRELQFRASEGIALIWINVGVGCVVPFLGVMWIGGRVAQALVRRRTPAQVAHLASKWQIAETELARIAAMAIS